MAIPTATPAPTSADPLAEMMDTVGSRTSAVRQLFELRPVDRQFIDRDELRARLHEGFMEDEEEIYAEQELYAALGILDDETDFFELLLEIYSEEVVGFFDAEEEKLFVLREGLEFGPPEELTYAHEVVHSLQQQHFDIHSVIEGLEGHADAALAFRALVEGDATTSELFYMFQHMSEEERAEAQAPSSDAGAGAFETAPHVIRRTFLFPYVEGFQFVAALFLQDNTWSAVNKAMADVPRSTEQILHPGKYVFAEEPIAVVVPDLANALDAGWTLLKRDTLGEFLLMAYLETDLPQERAAAAAGGWGGDSYVLLKSSDDESLLASLATWDSEADALEFLDAFEDLMRLRTGAEWKDAEDGQPGRLMSLPEQIVRVHRKGADTAVMFAPDIDTLQMAWTALQERRPGVE